MPSDWMARLITAALRRLKKRTAIFSKQSAKIRIARVCAARRFVPPAPSNFSPRAIGRILTKLSTMRSSIRPRARLCWLKTSSFIRSANIICCHSLAGLTSLTFRMGKLSAFPRLRALSMSLRAVYRFRKISPRRSPNHLCRVSSRPAWLWWSKRNISA